jgi:hypothetical protein
VSHLHIVMLNVSHFHICYAECHYTECRNAFRENVVTLFHKLDRFITVQNIPVYGNGLSYKNEEIDSQISI